MYKRDAVSKVNFSVRAGEILCIAGIDGNGQTELIHALTGLERPSCGHISLCGIDITSASIRQRSLKGMSHIPEDRHKHGLVLDFTLEQNLVLQRYYEPRFRNGIFIRFDEVRSYANALIRQYDAFGPGSHHAGSSMSGATAEDHYRPGNRPGSASDRGRAAYPWLDVGAIEYIHGHRWPGDAGRPFCSSP